MKFSIDINFLDNEGNPTEELRKEIVAHATNSIINSIMNDIKANVKEAIKTNVDSAITQMVANKFSEIQMVFAQGLFTHENNTPISIEDYIVKSVENGIHYFGGDGLNKSIDQRVKYQLERTERAITDSSNRLIQETQKKLTADFDNAILKLIKKAQEEK